MKDIYNIIVITIGYLLIVAQLIMAFVPNLSGVYYEYWVYCLIVYGILWCIKEGEV